MPAIELTRHPLNTDFEWPDHDGPFSFVDEADTAAFDDCGYFVAHDLFTADEVAAVTAELDRYEAKVDELLESMPDQRLSIAEAGAITFAPNLAHGNDLLRRFAAHPNLLGICRDLLGGDVDLYWDQAVYKKPDKPRRFPWHQDNGYTYVEPQFYLTCWIALTDATIANGCPQVVPGLHRMGTLEHSYVDPLGWQIFDDAPASDVAEVPAGGAVVFSSLTPHLTGPNTTTAVRKAYIVQYSPAGAEIVSQDSGASVDRQPVSDGAHVFPVLRAGDPVAS